MLVTVLMAGAPATAQAPVPDKTAYNLFNRTPRELWRSISPDRPDVVESPHTVDAGVFQIETNLVQYTHDGWNSSDTTVDTLKIGGDTNFKMGLLHNWDLQLIFTPYTYERKDPAAGPSTSTDGFSDLLLQTKLNLWGNDGGATAFAVTPFIRIPTGAAFGTEEVGGGAIWFVSANLLLDVGARGGIAQAANDVEIVTGLTVRF
jgi:hypothetical protein